MNAVGSSSEVLNQLELGEVAPSTGLELTFGHGSDGENH